MRVVDGDLTALSVTERGDDLLRFRFVHVEPGTRRCCVNAVLLLRRGASKDVAFHFVEPLANGLGKLKHRAIGSIVCTRGLVALPHIEDTPRAVAKYRQREREKVSERARRTHTHCL